MHRSIALRGCVLLAFLLLAPAANAHDPERGLDELARRIALEPGNAHLRAQRGELLRRGGLLTRALADFDAALAIDPASAGALLGRARALHDRGEPAPALATVQRLLDAQPAHVPALWTQARLLAALGRREAAADAFEVALAHTQPARPERYVERAQAHTALGRRGFERALAGLDEGIAKLGPLVSLIEPAVGIEVALERHAAAARRLDAIIAAVRKPGRWARWRAELLAHAGSGAPASAAAAVPATLPAPTPPIASPPPRRSPETVLVPKGALWRYLDDGTDQGTAWTAPGFDDSAWASGPAELGYGDGDEATVVSFGGNSANKYVTTYFRHSFTVEDASVFLGARLRLLRDDGAVAWLNGTEVARSNMPASAIGYLTLAPSPVSGSGETTFFSIPTDHTRLLTGTNVLAIEIHQAARDSSDISLDVELLASPDPVATRGPYLQLGTPASAVIRWRTLTPVSTAAWIGPDPDHLGLVYSDAVPKTEHVATLSALAPDTTYYYAIGHLPGIIAGGDADHSFVTPPLPGTAKPTRVWVIGDSGTAGTRAASVRDAYLAFTGNRRTDLWLMLGDNAYSFGTDLEYQTAVFDMYPTLLRSTFLWPTLGNHDSLSADSDTQSGVYYDIFTLPANAQAGGVPSGTEAYYSFDHGPVHFICLDSDDSRGASFTTMTTWLQADLANTTAKWTIAYWHHPPYSKGSHDSDNPNENRMIDMRTLVLPLLEAAGVDLVLTGHSHSYERSFLLDGHYGFSTALTPAMKLDRGNGNPASDGAYLKHTAGKAPHEGAVYVVAGSSGQISGGPLNHAAMVASLNRLGSLVLDVDGDRLDASFLDSTGAIGDRFTLIKGTTLTRDEARLSVAAGGTSNLRLDAGTAQADNFYFVLGSLGTTPGIQLGAIHIPLNVDPWFELTLAQHNSPVFRNSLGTLDANGKGQSAIVLPQNSLADLIGLSVYHAYVVLDQDFLWQMASNPVKITFVP